MDHDAIRKAYPSIVTICDTFISYGLDKDNNKIHFEQSKIDEARVTLDAEYALVKYKDQRLAEYPSWQTQLDYIYHHGIDKWKTDIVDPIKKKYPKPE